MANSQIIVRQVRTSSETGQQRFMLLSEIALSDGAFLFQSPGVEMTLTEVCAALVAHGISEPDALVLINEAVASFDPAASLYRDRSLLWLM